MRLLSLFRVPSGAPFFLEIARWLLVAFAFSLVPRAFAADDVAVTTLVASDFSSAHEALVEAIEAEGLVIGAIVPFNDMLARTASNLGRSGSPFAAAEIIQFCSSALAWQLLDEDMSQMALCPLSVAIYVMVAEPGRVVLAYRAPGGATAGRKRADVLLRRLVERAAALSRLRW